MEKSETYWKIRGEYFIFPLNASKINPWIQTEKKHRKNGSIGYAGPAPPQT